MQLWDDDKWERDLTNKKTVEEELKRFDHSRDEDQCGSREGVEAGMFRNDSFNSKVPSLPLSTKLPHRSVIENMIR